MKRQTHGILIWLVVFFAVFPVADGMVSDVPSDYVPTQAYWMGNLVAAFMMAAIIMCLKPRPLAV